MSTKNNFFFKKIEQYKFKNAIITENGQYITYQELLNNYASKSKSAVDKYKGIFLVRGGNKITMSKRKKISRNNGLANCAHKRFCY